VQSIAEIFNCQRVNGYPGDIIQMKSIRDLKKAIQDKKQLSVYPGELISSIDLESYNSRTKRILIKVNAWGGYAFVKINHIGVYK
jgi:hypothetical protein